MTGLDAPALLAFGRVLRTHPWIGPVLADWPALDLRDAWLSGSALAQVWWNRRFGFETTHGIADLDLVYFDDTDLSAAAETAHAARIGARFAALPVRLDVKNQARVHLWYAERFGRRIAPYTGACQAIATFPTTAAAIGVRTSGTRLGIVAPLGVADLLQPRVRANRVLIDAALYRRKIARWRALWPKLTILPWREGCGDPWPEVAGPPHSNGSTNR
jgi:uncharacterized protein